MSSPAKKHSKRIKVLLDIELAELVLANAALKTARHFRLLNDFYAQKIMEPEARGYPSAAPPADVHRKRVQAARSKAMRA